MKKKMDTPRDYGGNDEMGHQLLRLGEPLYNALSTSYAADDYVAQVV
jgi:hypothetical protein